ncbi:MAG TPA: hypothetical protein PLB86_07270 [Dermatophilaceae bacterium]|nr:hypothetical protein [Dermatophilaceae bacterium]
MVRKLAGYGFGLIALYLVVVNGTNAGKLIKDGATGSSDLVKAFQGR